MPKKNALDEKLIRILYILVAVVLGSAVLLGLTYVSKIADSPVVAYFTKVGEMTRDLEHKTIVEHRSNDRLKRLKWFEAYKSSIDSLRNPHVMLLGAHDNHCSESMESIVSLEDSLKSIFPLIHLYAAWGSKPEHQFPALQVKAILNMGSIPVITWEPWLTEFDQAEYPGIRPKETRSTDGLMDIANGLYDKYIVKWANDIKTIGQPIFLRWGHEMNDPYRYPWGPQNNKPQDYIDAWRHIHTVFEKEGVTNVVWIWTPHTSYKQFEAYFPGDKYVDYVGVDALNFGTVATWSAWYSFDQIFGTHYEELKSFKKPIMLAELGCLNVGGDRARWFTDALDSLPQRYPEVKSVMFFHVSDDQTTTMQTVSWYFIHDSASSHAIAKCISSWNR